MLSVLTVAFLLLRLILIHGLPSFRSLIPNGFRVPCPPGQASYCVGDLCLGVGHNTCSGGIAVANQDLNQFGLAFKANGYTWTRELCLADSDGDGLTNGQELGDPCCLYVSGHSVLTDYQSSFPTSHPGFANSVTSGYTEPPDCSDPKWIPASVTTADPYTDDDRLGTLGQYEYRMGNVSIPSNKQTIYFDIFFNFPDDKPVYIVGIETLVDNGAHLHHFVMHACSNRTSTPGVAFPSNYDMTYCKDAIYLWAPGGDNFVLPSNVGIKVGKGTDIPAFHIQIHYDNHHGQVGAVDNSGVVFKWTTNPRPNELAILWTGPVVVLGKIPPATEEFFSGTHCVFETSPGTPSVSVFGFSPHAHGIGRKVLSELWRKSPSTGQYYKVMDLGREEDFDFNFQYMRTYAPFQLHDQDVISTVCVYNSTERNFTTTGGPGTTDEMCINYFWTYPKAAYNTQVYCNGVKVNGFSSPSSYADVYPNLTYSDWKTPLTKAYRAGLLNCTMPDFKRAVANDDGGLIALATISACTTTEFTATDFAYMLSNQRMTDSKGRTAPCTDACLKFVGKSVLCTSADPDAQIGQVWNDFKESVFSRECLARLSVMTSDVANSMKALGYTALGEVTGDNATCADRPGGNVKDLNATATAVQQVCGNISNGWLGCSAECALALAGYAACVNANPKDTASKEAYCYVRRSVFSADVCGWIWTMVDAEFPRIKGICSFSSAAAGGRGLSAIAVLTFAAAVTVALLV